MEVQLHTLSNSTKFDTRWERSASRHVCISPGKGLSSHWTQVWVCLRARMGYLENRKISSSVANGTIMCGCPARSLLYLASSHTHTHTHTHTFILTSTHTPLNGFKTTTENSSWKGNYENSKKWEKELYLFEDTWTSSAPPGSRSVMVKMFNGEHWPETGCGI